MKIKFSILLIILFMISSRIVAQYNFKEVNANSNNPKLLSMPYSSSGGEKGTSNFEYDSNGKLIKSTWNLLNNSRSSINYYTYDAQGNIIKKDREFSDKLTSSEDFLYDNKNRLIQETFNRSDGFSYKVSYLYNDENQLMTAKLKNYHGWLTGDIHYFYDENNKIKDALIIRDSLEIGHIKFNYNAQGQLIEEYWEFTGSYNQAFTFIYETTSKHYTSSNAFITNTKEFRIKSEDYDFNQERGGPSFYYYSDDGKLDKKKFKVDGKIKTETIYNYDNTGLLISSVRTFEDGTKTIFKYTFNPDRKLAERVNYQDNKIIGSEHYEYKDGLLTKGIYDNFDLWLSGTLTFEYDSEGRLTKGFFKGKDGFDADIEFTYDNQFNITKIHWIFSFGKKQTYYFEYEKLMQ